MLKTFMNNSGGTTSGNEAMEGGNTTRDTSHNN